MERFTEAWCVGGAHLDLIGRASAPAMGGSAPGRVTRGFGGVALNVARGLARAGVRAALVAAAGPDEAGAALRTHLADAGVADRLLSAPATGAYLAIEDGAGALVAAVADLAGLEAMAPDTLADALAARPAGAQIVVDGNLTEAQFAALPAGAAAVAVSAAKAPRLHGALPRLAALFCNIAEAEALTGPAESALAAARALRDAGPPTVCVTDGPRAAALIHGGECAVLTPRPLAPAASNGAGDALAAAALAAIGRGARAAEALEAGFAAAEAIVKGTP